MRRIRTISILLVVLLMCGSVLTAQDLLDTDFYRQAERSTQEAGETLEEGAFTRSIELSKQSQTLSERALEYAEILYFAYVARAGQIRAENTLDAIDRGSAEYSDSEQIVIEDSRTFYRDGVLLFDEEQYELSGISFANVIAILDAAGIDGKPRPVEEKMDDMDEMVKDEMVEGEMVEVEMVDPVPDISVDTEVLPRYYRVRLIPEDRDSFSKISAYPFVYGRYEDWRTLYAKNKDKIVDSENPDLIHPGQLFEIPSLNGEVREGEWDAASQSLDTAN